VSINGEYLRVSVDELARAVKDPGWAWELVEEIENAEDEVNLPPAKARHLTTHKAWHAIAYLHERAQFPVNVVHGEEPFAEAEEWGYGPPRYLTPEQVAIAAKALQATSYETLIAGVSLADLAQADIYPQIWDEPDSLEWVRSWYEPLVPFFGEAAKHSQAMFVWLD
jgi:hypothetical protein